MQRLALVTIAAAIASIAVASADRQASSIGRGATTDGSPPVAQWAQFRGPRAGVADDPALPERWSATENVRWKTDVPGIGWSSPIVWGNRIFLTSVISARAAEPPRPGLYFGGERPAPTDEHRWMVHGLDWDSGRLLWSREVHRGVPTQARHLKNSFASETPVTDGERVYALFGNLGIFAFDMNGTLAWEQRWPARATRYGWGTASSPVLHDGRLYIVNDNDEESSLFALEARTGAELWRVPRPKETNWATPFVWSYEGRSEIVVSGTNGVRGYDLQGRPLWELRGMSSIAIPTPFAGGDLLYVSSGYVGDEHRPAYAIRKNARGDISLKAGETSNAFIAWSLRQGGPYNITPLVYNGIYYTLLDRGFFTAHDAATGRELYGRQRIDATGATAFTASPWASNGRVYALSEDGDTYVFKAGSAFEVLGKHSLGEMTMATPAVLRGSLLVRTASRLYRLARPEAAQAPR